MEEQLLRVFQTANHWNALILLHEADMYLEQRSKADVARNKLVSVFLRELEYCDGIMFLTTNRVSNFDDAILSRIHLMLKAPCVRRHFPVGSACIRLWGLCIDDCSSRSDKTYFAQLMICTIRRSTLVGYTYESDVNLSQSRRLLHLACFAS